MKDSPCPLLKKNPLTAFDPFEGIPFAAYYMVSATIYKGGGRTSKGGEKMIGRRSQGRGDARTRTEFPQSADGSAVVNIKSGIINLFILIL